MLVKEEAGMDTDHREGALARRVCTRKKKAVREADFVYERKRGRESNGSKKKGSLAQGLLWNNRLVKIELDAAQALADFSRLAHLPGHCCPSDLKWSERRKRTPRSAPKLEAQDAPVTAKACVPSSELRTSELDSTTSLSHGDKASPSFDSRAESPSSPLPSSRLPCRGFLVGGGIASNSATKRDVSEVVQKPIKTEMKELEPDNLSVISLAEQKQKAANKQLSSSLVKMELSALQSGTKSSELQHSGVTESKIRQLTSVGSQLVEMKRDMGLLVANKAKTAVTEDDKEARRLRRIQANRESARQTIRKKQILCEELRRKSASLASENEGMKQKRDMLVQELHFLRGQNHHLKAQLELGASGHVGSQDPSSQIVNSPGCQAPNVPCTYAEFPSHVYSWPIIKTQEGKTHHCPDLPIKKEGSGENLQELESMQLREASQIVSGIPASSVGSGVWERSTKLKDLSSVSPKNWSEEASCTGVAGSETGPPCDTGSIIINSRQTLEKEVDLVLQRKPELESTIHQRVSISQHSAATPTPGDCGLVDKHSTFRAPEHMERYMGLKVPFPSTYGSSCTPIIGGIPMNAQGFNSSYPWRMTHVMPSAAAEARKRRKELTRKKRLCAKASKLMP